MTEPTSYIILRRDDTAGKQIGDILTWTVVGRSEARSAHEAIRSVVTTLRDGKTGTFAAVPARSWKPFTVTAETQVILKLEQPT